MYELRLDATIPTRDGETLTAWVYTPVGAAGPWPTVVALTPYTADYQHDRAAHFADRGFAVVTANVRGRAGSSGRFVPLVHDGDDFCDVVEWAAAAPFSDGRVLSWGGSYGGWTQWALAARRPAALVTCVPAAAACPGVDFPYRRGFHYTYLAQWLAFTSGPTLNARLFGDGGYWQRRCLDHLRAGRSFASLADGLGVDPEAWDLVSAEPPAVASGQLPPVEDLADLDLPVLTVTGAYDDDQPGALAHYRRHVSAREDGAPRHVLLIGPWDHGGTRSGARSVGSLDLGAAAEVDLAALHVAWFDWVLGRGPRPELLRDRVVWYHAGEEAWRAAATLEGATRSQQQLHLHPFAGRRPAPGRSFDAPAGALHAEEPVEPTTVSYRWDPRDTTSAARESLFEAGDPCGSAARADDVDQLVFDTAPLTTALDVTGFPVLQLQVSLDQADADVVARLFQVGPAGDPVLLGSDLLRLRHRRGLQHDEPVVPGEVLALTLDGFPFVSRRLPEGSRLRLTVGPVASLAWPRNYHGDGPVTLQTAAQARAVTVTLHVGSALTLPIGS